MFKIGDFARLGQVSVRMLRHYDKLGLLKPSRTDPFSGYRYYTLEQLARLHRIVALSGLGLTLQQIARLLQSDGGLPVEQLRTMLLRRQAELELELREKQAQISGVAARLQQLEHAGQAPPYEVLTRALEPLPLASLRATVPSQGHMPAACRAMCAQLYAALEAERLAPAGVELTVYHNQEYVERDLDVEIGVVVDPAALGRAPGGGLALRTLEGSPLAAALIYQGGYSGLGAAVLALLTWLGQQGCVPAGPLRELHLSGPAHQGGRLVEPAVIELQVPAARVAPTGA